MGLTWLRTYAEDVLPVIAGSDTEWLIPPDATALRAIAAWTWRTAGRSSDDVRFVVVANYGVEWSSGYFGLLALDPAAVLLEDYSTTGPAPGSPEPIRSNGFFHRIDDLAPGEGRVYRVARDARPAD